MREQSVWSCGWRLIRTPAGLSHFVCYVTYWMLPLLSGLITKWIFDSLTGARIAGLNAWSLIGLLIGVEFGRLFILVISSWLGFKFWFESETTLRSNMMDWIVSGPGSRVLPGTPGEVVSRFRDDVAEVMLYLDSWMDTGAQTAFAILALIIMIRINAVITLVVAGPLIAIATITQRMSDQIQGLRRKSRAATAQVTSFIGEMFGNIQAIKVASAERHLLKHFERLNEERQIAATRDILLSASLDALNACTSDLGLGLILLLSAQAMRVHNFSVGDFTLFASYIGWAAAAPRWIGRLLARQKQAGVSVRRMTQLLEGADPKNLVAPLSRSGETTWVDANITRDDVCIPVEKRSDRLDLLAVKDLTCAHPVSGRGIRAANFSIKRGSFTVVTGRVGAGKTTLLRALVGLIPKDSGTVVWNDTIVDDLASFMIPPHCAYTGQVPHLFSDTLRNNILMGFPATESEINSAIELAVLDLDVSGMLHGLDTPVGVRGVTLSGGQLQRAAAARMFVRNADLLVFDDLSSALDVETEQLLWTRLKAQPSLTCIIVSHRRAALQIADSVIVLEHGRITAQGSLESTLKMSRELQQIWSAIPKSDSLERES